MTEVGLLRIELAIETNEGLFDLVEFFVLFQVLGLRFCPKGILPGLNFVTDFVANVFEPQMRNPPEPAADRRSVHFPARPAVPP